MGYQLLLPADDIDHDARLDAGVVIVGSGAAGIPLALNLADRGIDVILLEAGQEQLSAKDQAIYSGHVADRSRHPPADKYRQRCLGGTTGTWGGRCVPFDPVDFIHRQDVPNSGWPIEYAEVSKYYPAANRWLEAGAADYSATGTFKPDLPPMIPLMESALISTDGLERFSRPTNLYARYKSRLSASRHLQLIYGANCTSIGLDSSGNSVDRLELATLEGKRFSVTGGCYVIACGGIETARLLLASNDVKPEGIGNDHDVVGRYYMCHIAGNTGKLTLSGIPESIRHGYEVSDDGIYCRRRIEFNDRAKETHGGNNVVLRLHFPRIADPAHKSGVLSLIYLMKPFISYEYATRLRDADSQGLGTYVRHVANVIVSPLETVRFLTMWIRKRILASRKFPSIVLENKTNVFSLEINAEQAPDPHSRITLSEEVDVFGMPRVIIDWCYSASDIAAVRKLLDSLAEELLRTGAGTLEYDEKSLEADLLRFGAYGGHHIGTARMGTDRTSSVVNGDCRVHDVENLYIAGSATFPTSSQANPTLTITAMALRLADHIAKVKLADAS